MSECLCKARSHGVGLGGSVACLFVGLKVSIDVENSRRRIWGLCGHGWSLCGEREDL